MKFASVILLSIAAVQTAAQEIVAFGVYKDAACTTPYRAGVSAAQMEAQIASGNHGMKVTEADCDVMSYTSPTTGQLRTNANGRFNCEADHVTFTHWPNSNVCGGSGKVLLHTLYTNKCVPVQTHMGVTYQKLLGYTPCSAKHPYSAAQLAEAATGGVNQAGAHATSGQTSFGGFQGSQSKKKSQRKKGGRNSFGSPQFQPSLFQQPPQQQQIMGQYGQQRQMTDQKAGQRGNKGGRNSFGRPQLQQPSLFQQLPQYGQQQQIMGQYGPQQQQIMGQYGQQFLQQQPQMPQQIGQYGQQQQQQYSPFSRFQSSPSPVNFGFSGFGTQQQGFGQQMRFGQQQGRFGIMGRLG
jgi:hypothetical protein